jgi:cytochrome bd-type quinol oxidase subunit 2
MNNNRDNNYVSIGSWMWMMFVTALPLIGVIMIFVWAFSGDNESRKNYYKAILAWALLVIVLIVGLVIVGGVTGHLPDVHQHVQGGTHKL